MTAKKSARAPSLKQRCDRLETENAELRKRIIEAGEFQDRRLERLEREANERIADKQPTNQESVGQTIDGMALGRGRQSARRHATPAGPNNASDIFPPGCGPLQLVWSSKQYGDEVVVGWQGDSFHHFASRTAAVTWLLGIAQRILANEPPAG